MDDSRPRSASPQPHRSDPNAPERCTRPDPPRAPWGREKVRAALGLAIWEIELAIETGLLRRLPDRDFEATAVEAALADPEAFRALLAAEHRLNAPDAAGRLGISRQRFARVVKQAGLEPVAEEQMHRYRRLLTVRYYRAADVDTLQPYVGADIALREAATAVGRSDAAQKAAHTRARNRERAREARLELDAARPDDEASPLRVLRYAAGLAAGRPEAPSFLRRFTDDPAVQRLATLVTDCRLRDAEHAQLVTQIREQARVAFRAMAGPSEIRSRLGVEPRALTGHAEMIEWFGERRLLAAWETDPPGWLLTERAAQAAADAARAAHQARSLEPSARPNSPTRPSRRSSACPWTLSPSYANASAVTGVGGTSPSSGPVRPPGCATRPPPARRLQGVSPAAPRPRTGTPGNGRPGGRRGPGR